MNRIMCCGDTDTLEGREVGQIASRGMQTFLFSLPSYLWALGLCLLTPAPCLALHQSHSPSAHGEIHSHGEYRRDGAFLEPWVAVASIVLGLRDARSLKTTTTRLC